VILRCTIDDLLLDAVLCHHNHSLVAFDGDEAFTMDAVEAIYYEVLSASPDELLGLEQAGYRLLRRAEDFAAVEE
jgi:hypothetical protein